MTWTDLIECTIDFEGQKKTDQLAHALLIITGVVSLIVGYSTASLQQLLVVFVVGFILTIIAVLPPWPMYNQHPQPFIAMDTKQD
ncbi:microsomal signal peptidase [Choanephora cucurbitarum]|nr:microsomal signal peptidase [Choanephora cucurbitarum]